MTKNIGKVIKLFISHKNSSTKIQKDTISLDNGGIKLDKYYNKDINRSILLTSTKAYNMIKSNNINVQYGQLGENILVDFDPYTLKIGTKIQINQTILEVTQHCTLCNSLTKIDNCVPKLLKNDRGVFTKVIKDGVICKEDKIFI
jgi:MOSC domain-containing protein YiiM